MVNWFCSSALRFNNYKSKDLHGKKLKYHRLPRENSEIQSQYKIIFQTDGFNQGDGYTYTAHWSTGETQNIHDLPNILLQEDHFEKKKRKYTAKNVKTNTRTLVKNYNHNMKKLNENS